MSSVPSRPGAVDPPEGGRAPSAAGKVPFRHWFPVSFDLMGRWESKDRDGNVIQEARPPRFEIVAILMLGIIASRSKAQRGRMICTLTNPQLAALVGRSESEVRRHLVELEETGMIRRVYGASRRTRLGIEVTISEEHLPGSPESHPGGGRWTSRSRGQGRRYIGDPSPCR